MRTFSDNNQALLNDLRKVLAKHGASTKELPALALDLDPSMFILTYYDRSDFSAEQLKALRDMSLLASDTLCDRATEPLKETLTKVADDFIAECKQLEALSDAELIDLI